MLLTDTRSPLYLANAQDWNLYRDTLRGGSQYVQRYLEQFPGRETTAEFQRRLKLSHNPAFAAEAVTEVTSGIYARMTEISRKDGTKPYQEATAGKAGGVDLQGNSMNTFIGQVVLPELLGMGRVGVLIDSPKFAEKNTLADFARTPRPYMSMVRAEHILNWAVAPVDNELLYTCVMIEETHAVVDEETGLPAGDAQRFRVMRLLPNNQGVLVRFIERYTPEGGENRGETLERDALPPVLMPKLKRLPFVFLSIGKSLLAEAAQYQIGLLNLASSDLNYALNANYPFYIEAYDPKVAAVNNRQDPGFDPETGEESTDTGNTPATSIVTGPTKGRLYPMGSNEPSFIHPSPEPLKASMEKQEAMKDDIRRLLNLAVSNVAPSRASAESKRADQIGLEAGLAGIGLELEGAEREIAEIWSQFEGGKPADVSYPTSYSLKSDSERYDEAKVLKELIGAVPGRTFSKEMGKLIARKLLDGRISPEKLNKVFSEIDAAKYSISDMQLLDMAIKAGICDLETGSEAAGFDPSIAAKAKVESLERLESIAKAQSAAKGPLPSAARGAPGGVPDAQGEKELSQAE